MLWVSRVVRVLRRLGKLRHVDVVLGPLGVAWVDVVAWDSSGLLRQLLESIKMVLGGMENAYGELGHDRLELGGVEEARISKEF